MSTSVSIERDVVSSAVALRETRPWKRWPGSSGTDTVACNPSLTPIASDCGT